MTNKVVGEFIAEEEYCYDPAEQLKWGHLVFYLLNGPVLLIRSEATARAVDRPTPMFHL